MSSIDIAVVSEQTCVEVDESRLRAAIESVLSGEGWQAATVSVAVVDDAAIRDVNRRFLQHDYATDVVSFVLEEDDRSLDAEIVVSAEMAARRAGEFGWSAHDELLLYIIHGTLHLAGYDDQTPELLATMRERERHYLAEFGLTPHYDATSAGDAAIPDRTDRNSTEHGAAIA